MPAVPIVIYIKNAVLGPAKMASKNATVKIIIPASIVLRRPNLVLIKPIGTKATNAVA